MRSGKSTYVSCRDESNRQLDILIDSQRFMVQVQLHDTSQNYTTKTKAAGSREQTETARRGRKGGSFAIQIIRLDMGHLLG